MPLQPPSDEYRRKLLATGTSHFNHHASLAQVPEELDTVRNAFGALDYEFIPTALDPTPRQLQDWVYEACAACTEDDLLVFYYTGHGESENQLYLLSSDSRQVAQDPPSRSTKVTDLAEVLLKTSAAQILLVLDVCHAGAGAGDFLKVSAELIKQRPSLSPAYVIAATRAKDQADEGALSKALALALANPDCRFGGATQRYLAMEDVMEAIKQYLLEHYPKQQAQCSVTSFDGRCLLFPNPHHRSHIEPGLDLASQRVFDQHWLPKAGAIESGRVGSYFTGRQLALRQICEWLAQPTTHGRAMVVTGGPGTGKSALLGRVVTLADPRYREQVLARHVSRPGHVDLPPVGIVDVAVHARHKLLGEVLKEITDHLNLSQRDLPSFLQVMTDRQTKTVIVIDALDEAEEAQAIVHQLLGPLSRLKHVFVLVGTRPDTTTAQQRFEALGPDTVEINLEHSQHNALGEVASYVERRLLASEEPKRFTPYRKRPALAREVAEAVASRADNVFLVAHTVAIRLLELGELIDTTRPDWIQKIPTGLAEAFNQYLAPLDACDEGLSIATVKAVLRALAFAEGAGLPWANLWRASAGAVGQLPITDDDIIEVRKFAAPFIVESMENERSVYRLYHEQLAEYLRESCSQDIGLPRRLWDALLACVPSDDQGRPDWLCAHSYLKRHAASFAFKAGALDEVTDDPAFLLVSDPAILRRYLSVRAAGHPMVRVYLKAFGTLRELSESERRPYLALALMRSGLGIQLPQRIEERAVWMPTWTVWNRPLSSNVLASLPSMVTELKVGFWGEVTPVVLVGRADGVIDVFQIDNGSQLVTWKTVNNTAVNHLSTVMTLEGQVLVAGWGGGQLGAFNVRTQQEWFAPDDSSREVVNALAVFHDDGQYLCVTAHRIGNYFSPQLHTELLLWDLTDFTLLKRQAQASKSAILSLVPIRTSAGMRILSGGDTYHQARRCAEALRLWNLDLQLLWESPKDTDTNYVASIYWRHSKGITYVLPQDDSRPVRVWQVESDGLVETCLFDIKVDNVWFSGAGIPGNLHLRRGGFTQNYALEADEKPARWLPVTPVSRMDGSLNNSRWTDNVEVDGHSLVLSASVGSVNIWNLGHTHQDAAETVFFSETPTCLYVPETTAETIYCGTESGDVVAFDADTGRQTWKCKVDPNQRIRDIAGYQDSSGLILAVATKDFIVLLTAGGEVDPASVIHADGRVYKISIVWAAGDPLIFASVDHGQVNAIRVWNLRTKLEQDTRHANQYEATRQWKYQLSFGQEDKPINSLICLSRGASTRLVFASKYSQIMVTDYPGTEKLQPVRRTRELFDIWKIPESMTARVLALSQSQDGNFIAAGTDEGSITLWHYPSRERFAWREDVHLTHWIRALAFNDASPYLMLASGADDGFVRFWDSELNPLLHINLGSPVCGIKFIDVSRVAVATDNGLVIIALDQHTAECIASD